MIQLLLSNAFKSFVMGTSEVLTMVMSRAERKTLKQSLHSGQLIQMVKGNLTNAVVRRESLHPFRYSGSDFSMSWVDWSLPAWTDSDVQARDSLVVASLSSSRSSEELPSAMLCFGRQREDV